MDSASDKPEIGHGHSAGDGATDGEWLTYQEIASRRGIKLRAAVRQVQRTGWRRQPGNDGRARICVPWRGE